MGRARGLNNSGGESSLGYLFESGESFSKPNKPTTDSNCLTTTTTTTTTTDDGGGGCPKTTTTITITTGDKNKTEEMSAGVRGIPDINNYNRTQGQNCGNFITNRPSTKVHAAPGGGSSLGYLFGSGL